MISAESERILQRYAEGNLSNGQLAEWLAGIEYDSEADESERDALAQLSLVLTEESEGMRPKEDVLAMVTQVLAREARTTVFTLRTDSSTKWDPGRPPTGTTSPVRHADI
jgi:hypothetical protein